MKLSEQDEILLYGHDKTTNIVAVETVPDQDDKMQIFIRNEDKITSVYRPMKWYVYVNETDPILDELSEGMVYEELLGTNFYNIRIHCVSRKQASWIANNAINAYMPVASCQAQLQTGMSLFRGMGFNDVVRAYIDIETLTKEGFEFPNSARPEDKICVIAVKYNKYYPPKLFVLNEDGKSPQGEHYVLCASEEQLIREWIKEIRKTNPDVLTFHNGFRFDMPYIRDRAMMHNIKVALGRNGSEWHSYETKIKFADKSDDYTNFEIYGRHVLDTYFIAKQFDIVKRELPSYGLKNIVKYLGKAKENRTYIEGSQIMWYWQNRRNELLSYAFDDVDETQTVIESIGQTSFYSTQLFPLSYQSVSRYGTGTLIDLWLVRDYFREGYSLPTPDPKINYEGAYTDTYVFGITKEPLAYIDVASLYPTMRDVFHIKPPKDELDVYDIKMKLLKRVRIEWKSMAKQYAKEGNHDLAMEMDSRQNSLKILLNTGAYGYIGWEHGLFNYYKGAAMITEWGQKVVRLMVEAAEWLGARVIRLDTDGALTTIPEIYLDDVESYVNAINEYVNEKFLILYNEWKQSHE